MGEGECTGGRCRVTIPPALLSHESTEHYTHQYILAAVIASFVFGMAGNVQKTKVVATTVELQTGGSITVVYQGGQDSDSLTAITITAPNGSQWYTIDSAGTLANSGSTDSPKIGAVMFLHPKSPTDWPLEQKHVVVIGAFNDGASQVILDTMV